MAGRRVTPKCKASCEMEDPFRCNDNRRRFDELSHALLVGFHMFSSKL